MSWSASEPSRGAIVMPMEVEMSIAVAVDLVVLADGLDDARGQHLAAVGVAHVGLDDGELVAAQAGHEIALAHAAEQALADLLQQHVADRVPERVVDGLEAVEVETEDGKALAAPQAQQRRLQLLAEQRAVGEVGEHVVARQVRDLLLLAAALGDVLVQRHPAAALQRLSRHGDDALAAELDRHRVAGTLRSRLPPPRPRDSAAHPSSRDGPTARSAPFPAASARPAARTSRRIAGCTPGDAPGHRTC